MPPNPPSDPVPGQPGGAPAPEVSEQQDLPYEPPSLNPLLESHELFDVGDAKPVGPPREWSVVVPIFILLLALIGSQVRDILTIYHQKALMTFQNKQMGEQLEKAAKEAAFLTKLRGDLKPLVDIDPAVNAIVNQFYPPPPIPSLMRPPDTNAPPVSLLPTNSSSAAPASPASAVKVPNPAAATPNHR